MTSRPGRRSLRERAFVNASTNIAGTIVTFGMWFVVTPVILHHLGGAQYGLWVLASTIVAYAPLLDLGIGDAITRYVALYHSGGDSDAASQVIAAGLWTYVVLALLTLALTAILVPFFPGLFNIPLGEHARAGPLLLLTGLNVAVSFPAITNLAVLRGLQRFDVANAVGVGATLLSGVAIVLVIEAGGNVVALAAIGTPVVILSQIPMVLFIRRAAPELHPRLAAAARDTTRKVLSFGIAQTVIRAGRQVRLRSDEIIIGAFRTVSVVTPYALVRRLSEAPLQLSDQLVDILLPLASQLHAQRDRVRLRELFIAGTRTAFAGYLLIGTSVALLASPFLRVWAGAAYAGHAAIAALLVCSGALAAGISPTEKVLASIGELKLPAAVSVASGVFKVGLAVVLIAEFGVIGVAVATLAAGVIDFIPLAIVGMRAAGVEVRAFLRDGLLPSLLCVASGAAGVVVARELAGDGSLATIVFDGAIGCFAFLIVYLLLPAAALERDLLARAIGRLKRRRRGSRRPAADSTELPPSA